MKALSWWWPALERLNEVLLSDAEAHSPAVALAVHQRMHILRRHHEETIDTDRAEVVDEGAILGQLQEPVGDGCQVVLIEGRSGTGKSHVVRWLEIQLDRLPDRASRVVLPVSKGSRLRDIVKQLCDRPELAGPQHAELRQQLSRAQEPVEPKDAASRLCGQLAFVCEEREREATRKQQEGRALTDMENLQRQWGHPRQLPHLLVYNPLRPWFVEKGRSMRRLVEHLHAKADPLAPRTEQEFVDADLMFEELPDDLDAKAAQVLGRLDDPDCRSEAVRVLNDALDEAKRILVHLNPGVVQEIFKSIRRELILQEKELVLLIEDFADLSGLKKEVLQASIQTGSPGGVKTYCTLRTVLAFTDGFLREFTVLSRAQHVYYVPNQLDEDHVVEQSVRLVGSYLYAARFGAAALEKAMREARGAERWLPTPPEVGDEELALLDSFGRSEDIPLFPFTRRVVERLVRDTYRASLLFVPRDVIRDVMPRVLNHRDAFERDAFPPEAFQPSRQAQLTDEQSRWLKLVQPTGAMRQRLESFLLYWGLNAGAARAFGLPEPGTTDNLRPPGLVGGLAKGGKSQETWTYSEGGEKKGGGGSSGRPSLVTEPFTYERNLFELWRAGTEIASLADRRDIRSAVEACIRPAWAWHPRIAKPAAVAARWRGWQESINIAGLRLAADVQVPPLTLVRPEEREDKLLNEALARELAAVYGSGSANKSPKTCDIDGIETHLAAHLGFVERHRPALERHLLSIWYSRSWDALPFLVSALAMTGAVLGVQNCGSSVPIDFIDALFADPPEAALHDSTWSREVLTPLRELRTSLRELLEKEIGAYQGDGSTVHGIDAARLRPFVPASKGEPAELPPVPVFPAGVSNEPDIKTVLATTAILGNVALASIIEIDARRTLAARVRAYLGEGLEKDALATALVAFLKELKQRDALTEEPANEMKVVVTALKKAAVVGPLESIDRLVARDASLWQRLVSLGRNGQEFASLANTDRILTKVDAFLQEHERHLTGATNIDPFDEALAAHETQLADARQLLGDLAPLGTNEDAT